jgi:predicted amidohydrolase YtcJ
MTAPDLLLVNGKITTMNPEQPDAEALAIQGGRITQVGRDADLANLRESATKIIDLQGKRVIPGLNDSHTHVIRGGLTYNTELRWEGVDSLGQALEMLRDQARRTPAPQWVRVVGGWSEFQFKERRMPTLEEINEAAPDTPVFILHLYARALLNKAALRVLGYDRQPPEFDRGVIERDASGNATGMLIAKPSALILYKTLAAAPRLSDQDQINSTRQFMRELNRLGVSSVIDAGGGGQNYPDDYQIAQQVRDNGQATLRIAYNLFAQQPGTEYDDYLKWVDMTEPGQGDDMLKAIGAGENLVWSAADFENFLEPRPDLPDRMEPELEKVIALLASRKWPFRIHATYDHSIQRFLNVFEKVHRDVPIDQLHWMIDHAETVSEKSLERIAAMGGGVAIQHRMAFQGEYFIDRYGRDAVKQTPPVRQMLKMGLPIGGGTDATRVASYNPWTALYWLTTGRTVGGTAMYGDENILTREEALRIWTEGSAWFSTDQHHKGRLQEGHLADLAVLSADYFAVPDEQVKNLASVMTVVDGKVVYGDAAFKDQDPGEVQPSPDWSPAKVYPGHQGVVCHDHSHRHDAHCQHSGAFHDHRADHQGWLKHPFGAGFGCDCFAF